MRKISKNIMETGNFKDAIFYRVGCDCGDSDCDKTIELEYDKELDMLFLNFYGPFHWTAYHGFFSKLKAFKRKIITMYTIFFKNYINIDDCLIIKDERHIDDFIYALQEGKRRLIKRYK